MRGLPYAGRALPRHDRQGCGWRTSDLAGLRDEEMAPGNELRGPARNRAPIAGQEALDRGRSWGDHARVSPNALLRSVIVTGQLPGTPSGRHSTRTLPPVGAYATMVARDRLLDRLADVLVQVESAHRLSSSEKEALEAMATRAVEKIERGALKSAARSI